MHESENWMKDGGVTGQKNERWFTLQSLSAAY